MLHVRNAPGCFSGRAAPCAPATRRRIARKALVCRAGTDPVAEQRAELETQLKAAVAAEDFSLAAQLKRQIDLMQPPPSELEVLQAQLQHAIAEERYEDAASLRDEIARVEEALKPPKPDRSAFEQLPTDTDTLTQGVRIRISSAFVPAQSLPAMNQYFYVYSVSIANEGQEVVQLLNRHWHIKDADGGVEHVRGPGVVGKQPVLRPGDCFEYQSACPLRTDLGSMEGEFEMVVLDAATGAADGLRFEALISEFALKMKGPVVDA